jgi:hypothetical protein
MVRMLALVACSMGVKVVSEKRATEHRLVETSVMKADHMEREY